jgi:hypothetical protein
MNEEPKQKVNPALWGKKPAPKEKPESEEKPKKPVTHKKENSESEEQNSQEKSSRKKPESKNALLVVTDPLIFEAIKFAIAKCDDLFKDKRYNSASSPMCTHKTEWMEMLTIWGLPSKNIKSQSQNTGEK